MSMGPFTFYCPEEVAGQKSRSSFVSHGLNEYFFYIRFENTIKPVHFRTLFSKHKATHGTVFGVCYSRAENSNRRDL